MPHRPDQICQLSIWAVSRSGGTAHSRLLSSATYPFASMAILTVDSTEETNIGALFAVRDNAVMLRSNSRTLAYVRCLCVSAPSLRGVQNVRVTSDAPQSSFEYVTNHRKEFCKALETSLARFPHQRKVDSLLDKKFEDVRVHKLAEIHHEFVSNWTTLVNGKVMVVYIASRKYTFAASVTRKRPRETGPELGGAKPVKPRKTSASKKVKRVKARAAASCVCSMVDTACDTIQALMARVEHLRDVLDTETAELYDKSNRCM